MLHTHLCSETELALAPVRAAIRAHSGASGTGGGECGRDSEEETSMVEFFFGETGPIKLPADVQSAEQEHRVPILADDLRIIRESDIARRSDAVGAGRHAVPASRTRRHDKGPPQQDKSPKPKEV